MLFGVGIVVIIGIVVSVVLTIYIFWCSLSLFTLFLGNPNYPKQCEPNLLAVRLVPLGTTRSIWCSPIGGWRPATRSCATPPGLQSPKRFARRLDQSAGHRLVMVGV